MSKCRIGIIGLGRIGKIHAENIISSNQCNLKIIIDPGFGFGKSISHNYSIMGNLSLFKELKQPILVGISRKSMISKLLKISSIETLNGTTALNMYALLNGAKILRVHDTEEANECIQIFNKITHYQT